MDCSKLDFATKFALGQRNAFRLSVAPRLTHDMPARCLLLCCGSGELGFEVAMGFILQNEAKIRGQIRQQKQPPREEEDGNVPSDCVRFLSFPRWCSRVWATVGRDASLFPMFLCILEDDWNVYPLSIPPSPLRRLRIISGFESLTIIGIFLIWSRCVCRRAHRTRAAVGRHVTVDCVQCFST